MADPISIIRDVASGVPVIIVEINLNAPQTHVTATMASGGSGHAEQWSRMIDRTQPYVAVTGTYFDIASNDPIGDLFIDGKLAHFGGKGTALCVTGDNRASFVTVPDYHHVDWSRFDFVIRSGPRLVKDGIPGVHMSEEGFHDPALLGPTGRLGIGITKYNTILLVSTRQKVTLIRWARALQAVGAVDAMNLDAGASMGLYIDGRTVIQPHRELTNLVLVYAERPRDSSARKEATGKPAGFAAGSLNLARLDRAMTGLPQATTAPAQPMQYPTSQPIKPGEWNLPVHEDWDEKRETPSRS